MRFNFKKVASVLASAVMLSSTIGFAAAASYPEPFVSSGTASGAVIVGASAAISDWSAAIDLQQSLNALVTTTTTTTEGTVAGEAIPLFTGGTKLYINDSLNAVKNVLTKSDLPTVLADESFSGIVDATVTQTIVLGFNPKVNFAKQPTSSDDPDFGVSLSTNTASYLYNATATFSKAVDFTNASSKGESITLFGQKFTVGAGTSTTDLVLLKSAEKLSLDSDNPTAEVTIAGKAYTIELVSASDTSATIQVTDSEGNTNSKEINEADSKKVGDITIAVTNSDETNLKLSASIVAGAEKVTLTSGSSVAIGESNTVVDGTMVTFTGGTTAMTKLVLSIAAKDSDSDAIKAGQSFTDPVFGTFKIDFSGLNIADDSTARETINVDNTGDDKMEAKFTDWRGNEKSFVFAKNSSLTKIELMHDDDFHNISVKERDVIKYQDYVVVGNEDEGYLLKLSSVKNQTTGYSNDYVKFTDVFSGDVYETVWAADGDGTVTVGGKSFTVALLGDSTIATESYQVRLNYPDSSTGKMIIYPVIQTVKGAKVMLYEPQTINFTNWDGAGSTVSSIMIPNGDGYEELTIAAGVDDVWTITDGGAAKTINLSIAAASTQASVIIGNALNFTFVRSAINTTAIYLNVVGTPTIINDAAFVVLEEKDDNNQYQAIITTIEPGTTGDDGIGVSDVDRTWGGDSSSYEATLASDSKITKEADLWGSIITTDASDSDQKTATISYPDEQINAQLYMAEESAAITPGGVSGGGGGQVIIVKDSEVSSVAGKNLVVIGGSCINTVAAKIIGSETPLCGADFTAKTNVGAGQYLIKTVASPYAAADSGKVAMLVAGYEAADTVNAVSKAMEGVKTDVNTEQVYPITTTATA
jgi:hypothetical protein